MVYKLNYVGKIEKTELWFQFTKCMMQVYLAVKYLKDKYARIFKTFP